MTHGPYYFNLEHDPECPYCRQLLLPPSTVFTSGTAFCQSCFLILSVDVITEIIKTQYHDELRSAWTTSRGLMWFTPSWHHPKRFAAHLLYDQIRQEPSDVLSKTS